MTRRIARTPTILQMEAVECGAAALGIVLGYHGRHVALPELREACSVSRDGTCAAAMVRAARRYGLEAGGVSVDLEGLRELQRPAILFWKFNHFVVLEGWSRRGVWINDPARGRVQLTPQQLDEGFTGVALELAPGPAFERGGCRPGAVDAVLRRLRGHGRDLMLAVVAGLLLVVPALAATLLTQLFIDAVLIEGRVDWVRPILLAFVAAGGLRVAIRQLQLRHLRAMRVKLSLRTSARFVWHVLRLPMGFFTQRFPGEIARRATLNDGIADILSGRVAAAAIDGLMVLVYVALMAFYDLTLTVVALGVVVVQMAALHHVARRRADANARLRVEDGKSAALEVSALQGLATLKANARESEFFRRWAGQYTRAAMARQELVAGGRLLGLLPGLAATATAATVLVVGGLAVIDGRMTLGMLIAFQILCGLLQRPVATVVALFADLQTLGGDMQRVDDVLSHPADAELSERPDGAADELLGGVELRDVTFGYGQQTEPLLRNLDLEIAPGRTLALVGGSGSGKSTVARLVCGLVQPRQGEVLLDGRPRRSIPRETISGGVAMVDQDIRLFAGTVRDNLTLWDPSVSLDDVRRAARDAQIEEAVLALPGGYEAELHEDGRNLSGGQRQRLELARALVRSPSVLVLDEATSALDPETERRVVAGLRERGCTMLIVAHRLSTVRDADEIVVLDGGEVVERGTHDALWARGGVYRRLLDEGFEVAA